ncbi:MAG TPA: hypothetical protein VN376_09810, partial [Longilinea sp.]|nr:hypothetical protein [Longilinea sp.]
MPVNYTQLQAQIKQAGSAAVQHEADLQARLALALQQLPLAAADPEALRTRISTAAGMNPNLRSAIPGDEAIHALFSAQPAQPGWVILAGDGSQKTPSHHDAIAYGLINIGI